MMTFFAISEVLSTRIIKLPTVLLGFNILAIFDYYFLLYYQ